MSAVNLYFLLDATRRLDIMDAAATASAISHNVARLLGLVNFFLKLSFLSSVGILSSQQTETGQK